MKHLYLIVALLSLATQASAYDVDGIYYNITLIDQEVEVTTSGSAAYSGDVTIPSTVTIEDKVYNVVGISDNAFDNCTDLTSVTLPESVTKIKSHAFEYCTGLTSITMPGVESIDAYAFYNCENLTSVDLPAIKTIGEYAFEYCDNLKSVSLAGNISSISNYTFAYCKSLETISLSSSITSFGDYSFANCINLKSIIIPEEVTTLGAYAFRYCTSLTTIKLPAKLSYIGEGAFEGNKLESFEVEEGNTKFTAVDGVLYDSKKENIYSFPSQKSGDFVLPSTVSTISPFAFYGCDKITSFTIPSRVKNIGRSAFANCTSLTTLTNESVTPQSLDPNDYVFGSLDLSKIKLIVPTGSAQSYKTAEVWSGFNNIISLNAGDFNNDGNITVGDMALLIAYLNGTTVEGFDAKRADINNDGSVNMTDLEALKGMALELAQ